MIFKKIFIFTVVIVLTILINEKEQLNRYNYKHDFDGVSLVNNSNLVKCTLQTCFNLKNCEDNFKIYIYDQPKAILSDIFQKILNVLKSLGNDYLTKDPKKACLYISSFDTIDRDRLDIIYVKNLEKLIKNWNETNHLIFNLYSGTWPSYLEELDFNASRAILAKASVSTNFYRENFDISFPLFSSNYIPEQIISYIPNYPNKTIELNSKKYLLTFKGKRYLNGISSEIRSSIRQLNNGQDILILTTCKHGSRWQELKDDKCDSENDLYDKYDYDELFHNSTFCLVPRGRRLGTYRFLEALKIGCIPVILSNGWVLPFSEVLDWSKAVIWGDEQNVQMIPTIIRQISSQQIAEMKYYCIFFFNEYFSTIEKITKTTIEVI